MAEPPIRGGGIRKVIHVPWRRAEAVVATALGLQVEDIWPERCAARIKVAEARQADQQAFAERLRQAVGGRRNADVARALGVSRQAFHQYFTGVRPSGERAAQLASILGVDADWLVGSGTPHAPHKDAA